MSKMLIRFILAFAFHLQVVQSDENLDFRSKQVDDVEVDNGTCITSSDCPQLFSTCVNGICSCLDGYLLIDEECRPATVSDHPKVINCVSHADCHFENAVCISNQCVCRNGFTLIGSECVDKPSRSTRFANDGYQSGSRNYFGEYCDNVYNNCGGHGSFKCNPHTKRCVCALGFVPTADGCSFTGFPPPNEKPGQYSTNVNVNSNPQQTFPPVRQQPYGSENDNQHQLSYRVQFPANPVGVYEGAHGHYCRSSADCKLHYLFCNPVNNRCECLKTYTFENGNCVRVVSVSLKPGYSSVSKSGTRSQYVSHGSTCYEDRDCYSELLVCNLHYYQCVCARQARLDGRYCVTEESYQTPTEYHKPTVTQHYNPPTTYPGPVQTHNVPNTHPGPFQTHNVPNTHPGPIQTHNVPNAYPDPVQTHNVPNNYPHPIQTHNVPNNYPYPIQTHNVPNAYPDPDQTHNVPNTHSAPYKPGVAPPYSPSRIHPVPPNYPTSHIPWNTQMYPPNNFDDRQHERRSVGNGKEFCTENNDCHFSFTYCNKATYKCECKKGYVAKQGICVQETGEYCITDSNCYSLFTRCENNKCMCVPGFQKVGEQCVRISDPYLDGYCNHDGDCWRHSYSRCWEGKCSCADSFSIENGLCVPTQENLHTYCDRYRPCDTHYSQCNVNINNCVCKAGYARYLQSCIQDEELHGRCSPHGTCKVPGVICNRFDFRCKCAYGNEWSCA